MQEKGGISVQTEHIFPIIKRWLYSEKDIFLRELVSNASDAAVSYTHLDVYKRQHHNHNANEDKDDEDIYYDEGDEEFVTLQCNFCEELFFIDVKESGTTVECPFCKKQVIVADTIIE